jgi:transposase
MKKITHAKFFAEITVNDPDTNGEVKVLMFKHQNGSVIGIDASYINLIWPEDGDWSIIDPFIDEHLLKEILELRKNPGAADVMALNNKLSERIHLKLEGI